MRRFLAFGLAATATGLLATGCGEKAPSRGDGGGLADGLTRTDGGGPPPGKALKFLKKTVDEDRGGTQAYLGSNGSVMGVGYYKKLPSPITVTCPASGGGGGSTSKPRPAADVMYSHFNGTDWGAPVKVDQYIGSDTFGLSVAIDASGKISMGYVAGANNQNRCDSGDAMVASSTDGQAFSKSAVFTRGGTGDTVGHWMGIAYDASGQLQFVNRDVHFGYYEQDGDQKADVRYGPTGEAILPGKGGGLYNVLLFNQRAQPVVMYQKTIQGGAGGGIEIAVKEGTAWTVRGVASGSNVERPDFDTDGRGVFGIAYYSQGDKSLRYLESTDTKTWAPAAVVDTSLTNNGHFSSLAYDSKGNPAISYYRCGPSTSGSCDLANDALMFAYRVNGSWKTYEVDTGEAYRCGVYTSLAFTKDDNPVIAYQCVALKNQGNEFVDTLKVARGVWQ